MKQDFKYDIYISYALADNAVNQQGRGWVASFQKFLTVLLEQILGDKPRVLAYSSQEKPSLEELRKTALFVAIESPEYIYSHSCLEELEDFCKQAKEYDNGKINGFERIFKVVKYPVDIHNEPIKLKDHLSYDLYYHNNHTGEISEFSDFFNADAERRFWLKIVDLAYDIALVIKSMRNVELTSQTNGSYNSKNVYLAEVGADLQWHRDNMKRELQHHGFHVLPDFVLPENPVELEVAISKTLEKCRLSIHLIGDEQDQIIEGINKSLLEIENKLAGDYCALQNASSVYKFSRLIWISPDATFEDDRQRIFVDNLRRELEDNEGAEIVQSPIEDFKTLVLEELLGGNKGILSLFNESNSGSSRSVAKIYCIYDKLDEYEFNKFVSTLKTTNAEVIRPTFDGNILELREMYLNNLRQADYALIFVDRVNDLWVKMKYLDVLKAPGLGRTKGLLPGKFILGKNALKRKSDFSVYSLPIYEFDEANKRNMNELLNAINL